jgi:FdhD protein
MKRLIWDDTAIKDCVLEVDATRLTTDAPCADGVDERCHVATETPLTIDVEGIGTYTVLCTPRDNRAMAVGFLFSEGLIDGINDIALLKECPDDPNVIRVRLAEERLESEFTGRKLLIVSSCGMCGNESMEEKLAALPRVGDSFRVRREVLPKVSAALWDAQNIFSKTGGTHGIGVFESDGRMVAAAEDIGRHNALDKTIGSCILRGRNPAGLGAAMSGRVSLEMVSKCARAGIELISAVSAPTSLALEAARRCNITVLAFVRDTRATVFTCPHRIIR